MYLWNASNYATNSCKQQLLWNKRIDITIKLSNILSSDDKFTLLSSLSSENEQLNLQARLPLIPDKKQDMRTCKIKLKKFCRKRNFYRSGNKTILIQRLQKYDNGNEFAWS